MTDARPDLTPEREVPAFAHASEAEMARILDFYAVRWEYEPSTFPILWNLDGDVIESFSPDFYLPDLDMFLEMTTLKQRLVRKKNRKLRRLRELYPSIRIKLFYARDFRQMLLKYGRFGLLESLSGTLGQVVPDRPDGEPIPVEAAITGDVPFVESVVEAVVSPMPIADADAVRTAATLRAGEPEIGGSRSRRDRRRHRRDGAADPHA